MITIGTIRNCDNNKYDENWAIVRSLKNSDDHIKQVAALSPSKELFYLYRDLCSKNQWNAEAFAKIYVPQFLKELRHGPEKGIDFLNQLYKADKANKNIYLACFCNDETLCHRSIIAGLLQAVKCNVKFDADTAYKKIHDMKIDLNPDYTKYYDLYKVA